MAIRYECRACGRNVTGSAYRATCPNCGGILTRRRKADTATTR